MTRPPRPQPAPRRRDAVVAVAAATAVAAVTAAMTYSVVRYRPWIVALYALAAALLAVRLVRDGAAVRLDRRTGAFAVLACGLVTLAVRGYTYVPQDSASVLRAVLAVVAVAVAALLLVPRSWAPDLALLTAAAGHVGVVAAVVRLDPAPRIDVWYTLQGFADSLGRLDNAYTQVWVGPPGIMQAFTYLPWTGALAAPGRWLLGDVRWSLLAALLLGALALRAAGRRGGVPVAGAAAASVLLLLPGSTTQAEQAWTEPILLACLAGAAVALLRGRHVVAVVLVALALASKQHIAVLVPLLALWPRFGLRRTMATGLVAAALVAPWFVTAPAAMWQDTVTYLVGFPALRFSNTLYLAALNDLGWQPPFWLTGVVVVATVAAAASVVHRRDPGPAEFLRWCALVLLVANLVNKQAFYNQYWLVVALVVLSWALPQGDPPPAAAVPGGDAAAARSADPVAGEQVLQA